MRILFVAPLGSVHPSRWIKQLSDRKWDLHAFDPSFPITVNGELNGITVHSISRIKLNPNQQITNRYYYPFGFGRRTLQKLGSRYFANGLFDPAIYLCRLVSQLQPDLIHSLRTQDEGYTVVRAKKMLGARWTAPWIHSTYGSDYYYFGRFDEHKNPLSELATNIDYLMTDCTRDIQLVTDFGFTGKTLGPFPASGGINVEEARRLVNFRPPSERRVVAVKGKQNWAGRGLIALQAVQECRESLFGYKVIVHTPSKIVVDKAMELRKDGIEIEVAPYSSRESLIALKGEARIDLAISISDGTPNNMLESMVMGAFPIQSNTAATMEWIQEGLNGYSVACDDVTAIAERLRHALQNDEMVDNAERYNHQLMLDRIDDARVREMIVDAYMKVGSL